MALLLDIDAHGRVVPADEGSRRALADRAGRFELQRSAPDLLVARRRLAAGGVGPPGRCLLAGDLSAFPLADFVGFVHQSRLSGLLSVSSPGGERAVLFAGGEVRGARSDAAGERIGEVALRLGYITPAQLEEVLRADTGGGELFGKLLVERSLLSAASLWKCLHEQVASVFHGLLLAREGVFTVTEAPEDAQGTALSVNTQALLMDGIRRIDELSLFRTRIPGPHVFLRRRQPKVPATLKPVEQELLALVDGRRTLAELARTAHLSEFDATKVLYHLSEAGWVEATEEAAAAELPLAERRAALVSGMNDILRLIAAMVAEAGAPEPFAAGVRSYLSDAASRFAPLWRRASPGRGGSLDAAALLAAIAGLEGSRPAELEPSGDADRYLAEALRELMMFYLFQAGERLPREADERLGREVKRRFEALRATPR